VLWQKTIKYWRRGLRLPPRRQALGRENPARVQGGSFVKKRKIMCKLSNTEYLIWKTAKFSIFAVHLRMRGGFVLTLNTYIWSILVLFTKVYVGTYLWKLKRPLLIRIIGYQKVPSLMFFFYFLDVTWIARLFCATRKKKQKWFLIFLSKKKFFLSLSSFIYCQVSMLIFESNCLPSFITYQGTYLYMYIYRLF
jgi:hypothetical protein